MKDTHRLPPCLCPECGYVFTAAGRTEGIGRPPKAGDLSICLACGGIGCFDAAGRVQAMTADEQRAAIDSDADLAKVVAQAKIAVAMGKATFPGWPSGSPRSNARPN